MGKAKQPVSINGIEFDAHISEDKSLTANVPQYAVEDGFSVCDTIILEAEALSMVLYLTPTPVTWYKSHGSGESRVNNVIKNWRSFVYDNGASLKNKGMDFMLRRLKKHLADHYRKYGTSGAVYQFDFKNYFGSIPHDEIKSRMAAMIEKNGSGSPAPVSLYKNTMSFENDHKAAFRGFMFFMW